MNVIVNVGDSELHVSSRCLTEQNDNLPYIKTSIQITHGNRKRNVFQNWSTRHIIIEARRYDQDKFCSKLNHLLKCRFENSFLKYRWEKQM